MHRHARRIWMSKQIIMSNSFHMFSCFSIYRYIQATLIILLSSMKSLGNHGFDARHTSSASLFSGATTSATILIVLFPPFRMKCYWRICYVFLWLKYIRRYEGHFKRSFCFSVAYLFACITVWCNVGIDDWNPIHEPWYFRCE